MRWVLLIGAVALAAALWGAQFAYRLAPLGVDGDLAPGPLAAFAGDPPVRDAEDWMARRAPLLRAAFQNLVYGAPPTATEPQVVSTRHISDDAFGGIARIDELALRIASDRGETRFSLVLLTPRAAAEPAPLVIIPNFCGNAAALGRRFAAVEEPSWKAPRCRTEAGRTLTRALHGAHIVRPPFADLLAHGYAVATFSPGEIAPDDPRRSRESIAHLPDASADRLGAVGAWAWSISRVVDVVERDPRFDAQRIAVFGHSRLGKAALWATASDPRIALVIANQSGRLGASPTSSGIGERLEQLLARYPHWFPEAAEQAAQAELDQHLLLALIAPRPILLGGARLDRWSDPAGAFRSAAAASPVYELFGGVGLDQPDVFTPNLNADIAFFLRPGGHGVRPYDWDVARAFLDVHFARELTGQAQH